MPLPRRHVYNGHVLAPVVASSCVLDDAGLVSAFCCRVVDCCIFRVSTSSWVVTGFEDEGISRRNWLIEIFTWELHAMESLACRILQLAFGICRCGEYLNGPMEDESGWNYMRWPHALKGCFYAMYAQGCARFAWEKNCAAMRLPG